MRRSLKRFLTGILLIAAMTLGMTFSALAARIAFSDPSTTTGESFSINVRVTAGEGETIGKADITLSYDPSILEFLEGDGATGGAGTLRVAGSSNSQTATEILFVLQFRALRAGSATISISSQEVYNADSQLITEVREGSSAVTVAAAASDSTNANLAGLQVSPGTLSPAFSADVTSYTVTVGSDVDSLVVDAPAVDAGASVTVSGNESLQAGDNQVICTVTAQDGTTTKEYIITVTRTEGPSDGEGDAPAAEGVILRTPERRVTVYPVTDDIPIPEGFSLAQVSIDGHDVKGWVWEGDRDNPQYCVFYAENENGDFDFYRYDLTEKTLQRYFRDPLLDVQGSEPAPDLVEEYNSLLSDYNLRFYIIIGLIALAVILLIVIIALVATRGSKDDFYEKRQQDGGSYPERRKSERQKQTAAGQSDRRKISREERYMRGMEEEEEAAQQEEFRAEQQIRERQAQRRQAKTAPQAGQRQAGQMTGQRPAGQPAGMSGQAVPRPAGNTAARNPQAPRTAQYQPGVYQPGVYQPGAYQPAQSPAAAAPRQTQGYDAANDQNYVVRGPLPGESLPADDGAVKDAGQNVGEDDDFQVIDIGV